MFFKILAAKIIPCQSFPAYHFELAAYCVAFSPSESSCLVAGISRVFLKLRITYFSDNPKLPIIVAEALDLQLY